MSEKYNNYFNISFRLIDLVLPTHESRQTALSRIVEINGRSRSAATFLMMYEVPLMLTSAVTDTSRQYPFCVSRPGTMRRTTSPGMRVRSARPSYG